MQIDERLLERLRTARRVVVFTGAGVSQESGISTFRDRQTGLWENFDAMELATPTAFRKDPALVWGWYEWRRALILRAAPNAAHRAVAALETRVSDFTLVTQNVDNLHERAGSRRVLHLHGQLMQARCESCTHPYALAPPPAEAVGGERIEPPRCPDCGARIRPGVVWFGESLPPGAWSDAQLAAERADVFLCVGTSSLVQPAASLTDLAIDAGAITIQVNPNATPVDDRVSWTYRAPAGVVLPTLMARAWPEALP